MMVSKKIPHPTGIPFFAVKTFVLFILPLHKRNAHRSEIWVFYSNVNTVSGCLSRSYHNDTANRCRSVVESTVKHKTKHRHCTETQNHDKSLNSK